MRQTKNPFVAVTQCKKSVSQRLRATNNIEDKNPISLRHVTKELEKRQQQKIHSILNFTTAIKLLLGTLHVMTIYVCLVFASLGKFCGL